MADGEDTLNQVGDPVRLYGAQAQEEADHGDAQVSVVVSVPQFQLEGARVDHPLSPLVEDERDRPDCEQVRWLQPEKGPVGDALPLLADDDHREERRVEVVARRPQQLLHVRDLVQVEPGQAPFRRAARRAHELDQGCRRADGLQDDDQSVPAGRPAQEVRRQHRVASVRFGHPFELEITKVGTGGQVLAVPVRHEVLHAVEDGELQHGTVPVLIRTEKDRRGLLDVRAQLDDIDRKMLVHHRGILQSLGFDGQHLGHAFADARAEERTAHGLLRRLGQRRGELRVPEQHSPDVQVKCADAQPELLLSFLDRHPSLHFIPALVILGLDLALPIQD